MVLGSELEQLELVVADVDRGVAGVYPGGDVRVVVRARVGEFSGAVDAWILREAWKGFISELSRLERDRTGEAILESMSPGELRLRLFAVDRAGHMAAEGELSARHYTAATHRAEVMSLKFGAIEIDPTALPSLLRELQIRT